MRDDAAGAEITPIVPQATALADTLELQEALLAWVRLAVRRSILARPPGARPTPDGLSGFGVSDAEARALLSDAPEVDGELALARREVAEGWSTLLERLDASESNGVLLPLQRLRQLVDLDDTDLQIVAVLLGPEVDTSLQRLYKFAWNDFKRSRADVGFIADLLGEDAAGRDRVRRRFAPEHALRRHRLLTLLKDEDQTEIPFIEQPFKLGNRVVDFLRGEDRLDEGLLGLCALSERRPTIEEILLPEDVVSIVRHAVETRTNPRMLLHGPAGVGKQSYVEALAAARDTPLVVCDLDAVFDDERRTDELLALVLREALLSGAMLYLRGGTAIPEKLSGPQATRLGRVLSRAATPVFIGSIKPLRWLSMHVEGLDEVALPLPDADVRAELWRRALPSSVALSKSVDIDDLARRFSLSAGAVEKAAELAAERARSRSAKRPRITNDDLDHACRAQIAHNLQTLATRIIPRMGWKDLILPKDSKERLRELVSYAQHRRMVFEEWGFDAKVPYGRGLSALFSGPPGTGKTMGASIIARELGMELFRVDLSQIVDRYIGETEKNLGRVFDEATESHAILLFDEADSLFAKRTAVKSSVDRYANLEVNYLLQRMEDFDGVTILTTNFEASIDDAFKRRIRFRVTFPFPDEAERKRLWRGMFPAGAVLEPGIDWAMLARTFEMSGGHIKNAAVRGAFLAAESGDSTITQHLLEEASRKEYLEMGKLVRGA